MTTTAKAYTSRAIASSSAYPPQSWQPPVSAQDNGVANAFWRACITELLANKPGNVGLHADGHGMCADDFAMSARVAAPALAHPRCSVGERIRSAVEATYNAVGCNTNLGIVLLCAPLGAAAQVTNGSVKTNLDGVLQNLDVHDTEQVFEAIRIAQPAGLGESPRHDVNSPAGAPLLEVMAQAAERDRIAYQYTHAFEDVLGSGLKVLEQQLNGWPGTAAGAQWPLRWVATGIYLHFLANFTDTHIYRKLGARVAGEVRAGARSIERHFAASACAADVEGELRTLDRELKGRGINPGTSADLTVATLFAHELERRP